MSEICRHYDREEIDFHLILTNSLKKFVKCKRCKAWLYEIPSIGDPIE